MPTEATWDILFGRVLDDDILRRRALDAALAGVRPRRPEPGDDSPRANELRDRLQQHDAIVGHEMWGTLLLLGERFARERRLDYLGQDWFTSLELGFVGEGLFGRAVELDFVGGFASGFRLSVECDGLLTSLERLQADGHFGVPPLSWTPSG